MRWLSLVFFVASSNVRAQDACSEPPAADSLIFPKDGAQNVPTNTKPLTLSGTSLSIGGVDVDTTTELITLGDTIYQRTIPSSPFVPGAIVDVMYAGARVGGFTVGDEADAAAPIISNVQLLKECEASVVLTGVPEGVTDLLLVAKNNIDPTIVDGQVLDGMSNTDQLRVAGTPGTPAQIHVEGIDLAGNASDALLIDVVFEGEQSGCAQGSAFPFAIALIILFTRRSR